VHNFNNASTLNSITENVKEVIISNYRIEQLEKALRFSDSIKNKISLADEYVSVGRYPDAISLYSDCLKGFMDDDPTIKMKLLRAYFMTGDDHSVISFGGKLKSEKSFKNSEERVLYAWSLHKTGETSLAESTFVEMDKSFTNYYHRKEYCKFLVITEQIDQAKEKLSDLLQEFDHTKGPERRLNKDIFREIRDINASLVRS
jgi:hypothetical protein